MVRDMFLFALLTVLALPVMAAVKPHALISNGAVLQQGISVPVWGTANDGERVSVSMQGQKIGTVAKGGRWMVRLKPLTAGGPFAMTISGENSVEIKNVLVGEVWVCSGQSNMEFPLAAAANGPEAVAASKDPMLHLFTAPRNPQDKPQTDVNGSWTECGPETVGNFSAVGYFFGRDLRKALGVPVGLINASYGGTVVEAWTSQRMLVEDTDLKNLLGSLPAEYAVQNRPCYLHNGMIAPLQPYAIRGAIWYQGESNAGQAFLYRTRFPNMIRCWRADWGQGDFPFLFAQLAPFGRIVAEPKESAWAELCEAQLLTSINCPHTGMAVITDVGDEKDIHPTRKEPVGGRLALAARATVYGQDVVYSGPAYKSMTVRGSHAILSFASIGGGLVAKDGDLTGFTIAGEDHKFHNAHASIQADKVVVSSPQVPHPTAVRYGWADCPIVNLFNKAGLPASPFRTDDFQMLTGPKGL